MSLAGPGLCSCDQEEAKGVGLPSQLLGTRTERLDFGMSGSPNNEHQAQPAGKGPARMAKPSSLPHKP